MFVKFRVKPLKYTKLIKVNNKLTGNNKVKIYQKYDNKV